MKGTRKIAGYTTNADAARGATISATGTKIDAGRWPPRNGSHIPFVPCVITDRIVGQGHGTAGRPAYLPRLNPFVRA